MLRSAKQAIKLTWDCLNKAEPKQILRGQQMFRPLMKYQRAWLAHFHPNDTLNTKIDPWFYLHHYMLPLIQQHASSYHQRGICYLGLDQPKKPDFKTFQQLFHDISNGFEIYPVHTEIEPYEYFSLISQKKFPCIERLRTHDELFCANEPDFWHEAIGHIAPLCFEEVQTFYLEIADHLLSAATEEQFQRHLAVAWTLMEYGFIQENQQPNMFGAALVGSHLANMRYVQKQICLEPADRTAIINSGFFEEDAPLARDPQGRLRFFCLNSLATDHLF